jgi:penicillin-binding protein 1A
VDGPVSWGGYTPHNYENDYKGAMTLLEAFAESRNIPALKLAAHVGINKVIEMTHRFGVTTNIPAYLPIAIGAVEITLEEQVASYSVFPNDGLRVTPRLIRKVSNADGITLWQDNSDVNVVISQQTARNMTTLLRAVTSHGTGASAAQLNHPLGGKTGTTNNYTDAWFLGFSPSVTCGVWVGFDDRESLGEKETGAKAALPIWITVMREAIAGKDNEHFPGDENTPENQNTAGNKPVSSQPAQSTAKPASAKQGTPPTAKTPVSNTTPTKSITQPAMKQPGQSHSSSPALSKASDKTTASSLSKQPKPKGNDKPKLTPAVSPTRTVKPQ